MAEVRSRSVLGDITSTLNEGVAGLGKFEGYARRLPEVREIDAHEMSCDTAHEVPPLQATAYNSYRPTYMSSEPALAPATLFSHPTFTHDMNSDIYRHLRTIETSTLITTSHLSNQQEVTDRMRAILADWLVDVHLKYKCRPETMFLAVNILDRYLMNKPVEKKKLQLVGCVAMMLACKYEEVMPPEVRDFVHISANTYTRTEMLQMERNVLVELDYNLTVPTVWQFLTQLTQLEGTDDTMRYSAEYLAEQTVMCGKLCGFAPSMQAAACALLSRRVLGVANVWTDELQETSRYYESDLYEIVELLDEHMKRVPKLRVAAVRKKYSHSRYGCVSRTFDAHAEM